MKGLDNMTPRVKNHTGTGSRVLLGGHAASTKHIFGVLVPLVPFLDGAASPVFVQHPPCCRWGDSFCPKQLGRHKSGSAD